MYACGLCNLEGEHACVNADCVIVPCGGGGDMPVYM